LPHDLRLSEERIKTFQSSILSMRAAGWAAGVPASEGLRWLGEDGGARRERFAWVSPKTEWVQQSTNIGATREAYRLPALDKLDRNNPLVWQKTEIADLVCQSAQEAFSRAIWSSLDGRTDRRDLGLRSSLSARCPLLTPGADDSACVLQTVAEQLVEPQGSATSIPAEARKVRDTTAVRDAARAYASACLQQMDRTNPMLGAVPEGTRAVGALVRYASAATGRAGVSVEPFCTATLLITREILTSGHCVRPGDSDVGFLIPGSRTVYQVCAGTRKCPTDGDPMQDSSCDVNKPIDSVGRSDPVLLPIASGREDKASVGATLNIIDRIPAALPLGAASKLVVPGVFVFLPAESLRGLFQTGSITGCAVHSSSKAACLFHGCRTLPGWSGAPVLNESASAIVAVHTGAIRTTTKPENMPAYCGDAIRPPPEGASNTAVWLSLK